MNDKEKPGRQLKSTRESGVLIVKQQSAKLSKKANKGRSDLGVEKKAWYQWIEDIYEVGLLKQII